MDLLTSILFFVFACAVTYLAIEDHYSNRLSDWITLPMAVSGFVVNCLELIVQFIDSIAGAIIAYCGIQSLRVWQIHRHSQSNIGYGDAKYFGALGAWLGYQAIAPLLVGASLLMLLLYLRRDEKPFGVGLGVTALGLFGMRLAGE